MQPQIIVSALVSAAADFIPQDSDIDIFPPWVDVLMGIGVIAGMLLLLIVVGFFLVGCKPISEAWGFAGAMAFFLVIVPPIFVDLNYLTKPADLELIFSLPGGVAMLLALYINEKREGIR